MRILVIDHEENARVYLSDLLESQGFAVVTATNGREGYEAAKASLPDLIVSDIMIPEMDGFELCRSVKSDETLRSIPFIFCPLKTGDNARVLYCRPRFVPYATDGQPQLLNVEPTSHSQTWLSALAPVFTVLKISPISVPATIGDCREALRVPARARKWRYGKRLLRHDKWVRQAVGVGCAVCLRDRGAD